jgi:hypothetical protein
MKVIAEPTVPPSGTLPLAAKQSKVKSTFAEIKVN